MNALRFCLLISCLSVWPPTGRGAEGNSANSMSAERAVEIGRDALRESTSYPWYDSDSDEVRFVNVQPEDDSEDARNSDWRRSVVSKAKSTKKQNLASSGGWFWNTLKIVSWILIAVILVVLVYLFVRAFLKNENLDAVASAVNDEGDESDVHRVENLPFTLRHPQTDLLAEARRQYEQGRFSEAIIYLFSYQLVQLDKQQLIRLAKGKTNRQYLRELLSRPNLRELLERTMIAFEEVFFGDHPLDRSGFEMVWSQMDEFHQQLEHVH